MKWKEINSELGLIIITEDYTQVPVKRLKKAIIVLIKKGDLLEIHEDKGNFLNI